MGTISFTLQYCCFLFFHRLISDLVQIVIASNLAIFSFVNPKGNLIIQMTPVISVRLIEQRSSNRMITKTIDADPAPFGFYSILDQNHENIIDIVIISTTVQKSHFSCHFNLFRGAETIMYRLDYFSIAFSQHTGFI